MSHSRNTNVSKYTIFMEDDTVSDYHPALLCISQHHQLSCFMYLESWLLCWDWKKNLTLTWHPAMPREPWVVLHMLQITLLDHRCWHHVLYQFEPLFRSLCQRKSGAITTRHRLKFVRLLWIKIWRRNFQWRKEYTLLEFLSDANNVSILPSIVGHSSCARH